jgi:gamma-glutamyltranspeptidase/glutathione hydrolase
MIEGTDVTATRGVIATGPAEGARAGGQIFEAGGNAMDAAAAACLACAIIEPQAVDLGGYVAAGVVLEGKTGSVWSIDGNSVAPAATREDMYDVLPMRDGPRGINELEYGCSVRDDANVYGPLAVGVPGFLGGVGTLWERWGRLNWADVVAPARALVESGLALDQVEGALQKKRAPMARFGAAWHRSDQARTLDRLAAAGWRDFYEGELGRAIANFVYSRGGILTRADMAAFTPRVTEPCTGRYGGAVLHTAIAPNGGFSVIEALGESSPLTEDLAYWERLSLVLQSMWRKRLGGGDAQAWPHGTIHVVAADREGNLVSMTISQGGLFGSCLAVPGTGIILGHGMCRFDPRPGLENSPSPGKRPLNNVCPMIIRLPGRDVAIGARGGRRIVSVAVQLVQRVVDIGATPWAAASAPRIHTIDGDPIEISHNFDPSIRAELEARGHRIEVPDEVAGAAHGAEITAAGLRAGGNTWAVGV